MRVRVTLVADSDVPLEALKAHFEEMANPDEVFEVLTDDGRGHDMYISDVRVEPLPDASQR